MFTDYTHTYTPQKTYFLYSISLVRCLTRSPMKWITKDMECSKVCFVLILEALKVCSNTVVVHYWWLISVKQTWCSIFSFFFFNVDLMDFCRFSEQHVEERSMSTTTKTTSSYMETRTEMSNQETSLVSMMNGSGPSVTSEKRSSQQQVSDHLI